MMPAALVSLGFIKKANAIYEVTNGGDVKITLPENVQGYHPQSVMDAKEIKCSIDGRTEVLKIRSRAPGPYIRQTGNIVGAVFTCHNAEASQDD